MTLRSIMTKNAVLDAFKKTITQFNKIFAFVHLNKALKKGYINILYHQQDFFSPSTKWTMRGIKLLIAHRKSCQDATSRFRFFDLMLIMTENSSSHIHVEGMISIRGIA